MSEDEEGSAQSGTEEHDEHRSQLVPVGEAERQVLARDSTVRMGVPDQIGHSGAGNVSGAGEHLGWISVEGSFPVSECVKSVLFCRTNTWRRFFTIT